MNLLEINERLRQRPPFQMIERITDMEEGVFAEGIKAVSVNEPYFSGHFPEIPIMPGVLIIESAAQLCSLIMPKNDNNEKIYALLRVKDFKFLRPIIPGDCMRIRAETIRTSAVICEFSAVITVDGEVRAKGDMLFAPIEKSGIYDESAADKAF